MTIRLYQMSPCEKSNMVPHCQYISCSSCSSMFVCHPVHQCSFCLVVSPSCLSTKNPTWYPIANIYPVHPVHLCSFYLVETTRCLSAKNPTWHPIAKIYPVHPVHLCLFYHPVHRCSFVVMTPLRAHCSQRCLQMVTHIFHDFTAQQIGIIAGQRQLQHHICRNHVTTTCGEMIQPMVITG